MTMYMIIQRETSRSIDCNTPTSTPSFDSINTLFKTRIHEIRSKGRHNDVQMVLSIQYVK
jgi:hypothetical protein